MVIVNIMGGLGNQLFQYATAKRLALKHNVDLKLDPNFENDKLRDYKLQYFNINEQVATKDEILDLKISFRKHNRFQHRVLRKLQLLKPYYKRRVYNHKTRVRDLGILKASKNVYLDGYWGREIFFKDIRKELLNILEIKNDFINDDFLKLKYEISNKNSVSVHFRRGDYAKDPKTLNFFGLMPAEYYQKSIDYMNREHENNVFYVFSDDIEYVKQNFNFEAKVVYIENKNLQDYHELKLMSFCKHNIIANSTFSWWAAWLNENSDKTVIAPQKWYNDKKAQEYYEIYSFVPENWIKL